MKNLRLGVNIDHIATLRQARGTLYPDPLKAALIIEKAGAHQITVHLREDRRHIQVRDVELLKENLRIPLNLEIAPTEENLLFALKTVPFMVTFVPEKRQELTTESGIITSYYPDLQKWTQKLQDEGIAVSLFIDPKVSSVDKAYEVGAWMIELHTGEYSHDSSTERLEDLKICCEKAHDLGMIVHSGHGLTLENLKPITELPYMADINIGHGLIAQSLFQGLEQTVKEFLSILHS
jgi:pyridoxine 5-phosphate synthase